MPFHMLDRGETAQANVAQDTAPDQAPARARRSALASAMAALEARVGRWRARVMEPRGEPWLLEVPDVGPTCEVLLADQLFHDLTEEERAGLLAFVRAEQDPTTGAWFDRGGAPDLSLTVLGWWARVQAGDDPREEGLVRALRTVHALGGAQRANFQVRLWLAMAGAIPWSWLPAMPTELWLLPSTAPLAPARIAPWARGMLTPYLLIARAPARLQLGDPSALVLRRNDGKPVTPRLTRPGLAGDLLQAFDRTVKLARKLPRGPLLTIGVSRARRELDKTQQRHGGWFSTRPTLLSVVALRVLGAASDDARIARGLAYLRAARGVVTTTDGNEVLAQGLGHIPVRSMARLIQAAPDTGAIGWLLGQELCEGGPWQLRADAGAGGWPIESGGHQHLDVEATCSVLETLEAASGVSAHADLAWAAGRRAMEVLLGMQEADGSFGRFERGESSPPMRRLPWNDADLLASGDADDTNHLRLTALALERLAAGGFQPDDDRMARGLRCLQSRATSELPNADLNLLSALARCTAALLPGDAPLRMAVDRQLRGRQREDGSFGSVTDTARGLRGLLALDGVCVQARRAARWLVANSERPDGAACEGHGLSPRCVDASAPATEALVALRGFVASGGSLSETGA